MKRILFLCFFLSLSETCAESASQQARAADLASEFFRHAGPEWSQVFEVQVNPSFSKWIQNAGLDVWVVDISDGGRKRLPDGRIIIVKADIPSLWQVAVKPETAQIWRLLGFAQTDLVDLFRTQVLQPPQNPHLLTQITVAFSGRRLFTRLLPNRATVPLEIQQLQELCGSAPKIQDIEKNLPEGAWSQDSKLPEAAQKRGLVMESNCSQVFLEWWYFGSGDNGEITIERTVPVWTSGLGMK